MVGTFKQFAEAFGWGWEYKIPQDKEQQLYDFYMLMYLSGRSQFDAARASSGIMSLGSGSGERGGDWTLEDKIDYFIEEAKKKLLPTLREEILKSVFFSIASEMRHIWSQTREGQNEGMYNVNDPKVWLKKNPEPNKDSADWPYWSVRYRDIKNSWEHQKGLKTTIEHGLGEEYVEIYDRFREDLHERVNFDDYPDYYPKGFTNAPGANDQNRVSAYQAALNASSNDLPKFVTFAEFCFGNLRWESAFGDRPWEAIAQGWLGLKNADSQKEMATMIDHIYDLQHNTSTVFDKVQTYAKQGGYEWLMRALDHKAEIKDPREIINLVSSKMRELSTRAIKLKFGGSLEEFEKETKENKLKKLESLDSKLHQSVLAAMNGQIISSFFSNLPKDAPVRFNGPKALVALSPGEDISEKDVATIISVLGDKYPVLANWGWPMLSNRQQGVDMQYYLYNSTYIKTLRSYHELVNNYGDWNGTIDQLMPSIENASSYNGFYIRNVLESVSPTVKTAMHKLYNLEPREAFNKHFNDLYKLVQPYFPLEGKMKNWGRSAAAYLFAVGLARGGWAN